MMKPLLMSFLVIAEGAFAPLASAQERPWNDSWTYGVIVADLRAGQESTGPFPDGLESRRPLTDCSTRRLLCIRGHVLDLVVPKRCPHWRVGQRFSLGGTTTEVLAVSELPDDESRRQLLGNPAKPWVVYVYGARGVVAVYWDWRQETDLYALGKTRGLAGLEAASRRYYNPLAGDAGVVACEEPIPARR